MQNHQIEMSPLSQYLSADGKTVKVEICRGDDGGWNLEIIDEFGTSTIWDDEFKTEAAALEEAKKTIHDEGIELLICTDPWVITDRSYAQTTGDGMRLPAATEFHIK
ncbi:hypothetical protein [Alloalcanivorax gelatiniphagus]|jgi:hypothetical protein|uniref:hypothetical protein n=1 Tax=Alloalcanivorax gelatiniphagus TaxID=1194167 RepID=UPI00197AD0B4|nr:hypothetical protein [Alloalcanivorax gelatiniphagus]